MAAHNERNYLADKVQNRGEEILLPPSSIAPDPDNYNSMPPDEYTKLVESIREFGFIDPLVIREKASKKRGTQYETVNGAHRLEAAEFLGLQEIRCINLGKISDDEAAQLSIILNELRGRPDQVRLAERLRAINRTVSFDKLSAIMPFGQSELRMFIQSVDFSFASLSGSDARPAGNRKEDRPKEIARLTFTLPRARGDRVMKLLERIGPDASQALEKVVLEYSKQASVGEEPKPGRRRRRTKAA